MLVDVPVIKPAAPTMIKKIFIENIISLGRPFTYSQYVAHSIIAGKARPNVDKQKAPNNEINNSKFGIAMARKTAKIEIRIND